MVISTYADTKDAILKAIKYNAVSLAVDPNNIFEIGSEDIDFNIPTPYILFDFNFGAAQSHQGYLHILNTTVYIGVQSTDIGSAKVNCELLSSKTLNILIDNNLCTIPQNSVFKQFHKSFSNLCVIKLTLLNTIILNFMS